MPGDAASESMTTLDTSKRTVFRVLGFVLLLAGIGCMLGSITSMAGGPSVSDPQFESKSKDAFQASAILGFLGVAFMATGFFLLKVGFLKAGADIVSTETSGAVEHSTAALGRGIGRGLRDSGFAGGAKQLVKVKCRACGFLESEDARFCSQCAKPI